MRTLAQVSLLKKAGVKHIYARAIDTLHEAILSSFEIDRILTPEQRAAADLTHELELGSHVVSLRVDDDNVVVNFDVPDYLFGLEYKELSDKISRNYGLQLIAVSRPEESVNILGIKRPALRLIKDISDVTAAAGDTVTIFGLRKKVMDFLVKIKN